MALALLCGAALVVPPSGSGQSAGPVVAQPVLGSADSETVMMGAAPAGEDDETWAYRQLPLDSGEPGSPGLEFGVRGFGADEQLVFLRYTRSTGWRVSQTPVDEHGAPYRGVVPNPLAARVTPTGGGILLGQDNGPECADPAISRLQCPPELARETPSERRVRILRRDAGGRFELLEHPPEGVLLPASGDEAPEALAEGSGRGAAAVAAFDRDGRTAAFFGVKERPAENAVAYFDGETWSREPVVLPAGSEGSFEILALDATGPDNAWMLARPAADLQRGIMLFQRVSEGGTRWVERDINSALFSARETPALGISEIGVLSGGTQPITVTENGVWIDGELKAGSGEDAVVRAFTLYFDISEGRVVGSWCDVSTAAGALCSRPLGTSLSRIGYRSFAWPGEGFGSRIITNPLDVGGGEGTNRGTYLRLDGTDFTRVPGAGGNFRESGAFSSPDEGWIEGPVHVTREPDGSRLGQSWPLSLRAPLMSIASAPGSAPGDLGGRALAVGLDGSVARHEPGSGWTREFLLSSSGSVAKASLRGVAWPEPARAHAVGDLGAMWMWRAETGLWERDPATPVGFDGNLMDVAFHPGNPELGYAVGRGDTLLRYDKTWAQEPLPAAPDRRDLTGIAFAGSQAIVAAGDDLLVNDGGGWRVDGQARALLDSLPRRPKLRVVAGLPDGGAVAAGSRVVIERDGPGQPWRFSDQPLAGATAVAAAAFRDGGRVRAILSITEQSYPPPVDPQPDPNLPPPVLQPYPPSGEGYVLRETANGWRDEQHMSFAGSGPDRPIKSDPALDFLLDANGNGWVVGGWSGEVDSAGRGSGGRNSTGKNDRQRVQTAAAFRYGAGADIPPPVRGDALPLPAGPARFAVASHAQCEQRCAALAGQAIGPDRGLEGLLGKVGAFAAQPNGPRFLAYAGGRVDPRSGGLDGAEAMRYAQVLGSRPGLPVFGAVSAGDAADPGAFRAAFAPFNAPFGGGGAPPGIDVSGVPGAAPGAGARTHYAFDSQGSGGVVRMIVIDNSAGSLAASDPHQNPPEAQAPWLAAVLADAKAKGIPAIVAGSRDLNTRFNPSINVASDGDAVGRMLVEGGASAYFFERPEENRFYRVPAGGGDTIPAFGSGSLAYRSSTSNVPGYRSRGGGQPDALFGDAGFLLAEVDAARRDPATNRAPVNVRLIPLIEDVSVLALDGTLLRRSRPALFQGVGRRPRAGDRWGRISSADGNAFPPGGDPHVAFPPQQCLIEGCATRLTAEYEFVSSDTDIADFVKQDPNSSNLRKPFISASDKVVSSSTSGLLCAFNAGSTNVTIRAGGVSYSQLVRVLPGSVQRPCGTRPLNPSRFRRAAPRAAPPAAPPPSPQGSPPVSFAPPPPPAPAPPPPTPPAMPAPIPPPLPLLLAPEPIPFLPQVPPPPPPPGIRPGTPSGGLGLKEEREEEAAPEDSQAFARYHRADDLGLPPGLVFGLIVIAAFAGATIRGGPRGRTRRIEAAVVANRDYEVQRHQHRRSNR